MIVFIIIIPKLSTATLNLGTVGFDLSSERRRRWPVKHDRAYAIDDFFNEIM